MKAINRAIHLRYLFYGSFNWVLKNNKVHFKGYLYCPQGSKGCLSSYAKIDQSSANYLLKTKAKKK